MEESNNKNISKEKELEQSFDKAQQFADQIKVEDYDKVFSVLAQCSKLTPQGQELLNKNTY